MSAVSASSSSSFAVLEATTMIGLRVCSRIAATSVRREALGPRPVQDAVEMPPGEDAGGLGDVVAPAHHLELGVVAQALAEVREAVAVTGEVDARALGSLLYRSSSAPCEVAEVGGGDVVT